MAASRESEPGGHFSAAVSRRRTTSRYAAALAAAFATVTFGLFLGAAPDSSDPSERISAKPIRAERIGAERQSAEPASLTHGDPYAQAAKPSVCWMTCEDAEVACLGTCSDDDSACQSACVETAETCRAACPTGSPAQG